MSKEALNCVICGVGGQGNVLASRLIAQVLLDRNEHVKTAETIGMAQRGGSVASHVRGGRPQSPLVPKHAADVLIAFEPGEAVRCIDFVAEGGTIVVNTQAAQPPMAALSGIAYDGLAELAYLRSLEGVDVIEVDGTAICAQAGSAKCLNIVLLAAAVKSGALGISREELETAVKARVKPRFHELNLKAIELVFEA
jgi:indolepyruvate ferredoxin oxidoreductase beta subunit